MDYVYKSYLSWECVMEIQLLLLLQNYKRFFSNHEVPNPQKSNGTFLMLQETGTHPSISIYCERSAHHDTNIAETIVETAQHNPNVSILWTFRVSKSLMWRTLHNNKLYVSLP